MPARLERRAGPARRRRSTSRAPGPRRRPGRGRRRRRPRRRGRRRRGPAGRRPRGRRRTRRPERRGWCPRPAWCRRGGRGSARRRRRARRSRRGRPRRGRAGRRRGRRPGRCRARRAATARWRRRARSARASAFSRCVVEPRSSTRTSRPPGAVGRAWSPDLGGEVRRTERADRDPVEGRAGELGPHGVVGVARRRAGRPCAAPRRRPSPSRPGVAAGPGSASASVPWSGSSSVGSARPPSTGPAGSCPRTLGGPADPSQLAVRFLARVPQCPEWARC